MKAIFLMESLLGVCGKKIPMMSRLVDRNGKMKRQYFYQCRYNYDAGGDKKCCWFLARNRF